ncbi:MBL fold metallo-hydrolase [Sporosarcina highlanderae]|uniref:MBL fold metallo-hydrolase n=1 Tax=Sporosarcina highlanderae TaxID=3035916 RepID=A0ABT8JTM2_9BACL|nr:MBL fold metallo-hydrolase [Sporosarcina highlanderae]MDN4608514.1 MBL fold metallo-hydrolase [Sporosarcina highlanderae]
MFLKRESVVGKQSNVRFINGRLSFKSVRLNVHCFEVDGVMIDTGAHALSKEFNAFFTQADVDKVAVTHSHEDHTGGAAHLQKEYGLPVLMNEMSIVECHRKAAYPLYRQLFWGRRRPFQAQPIGETFTSRTATWNVIETPGHAKDHLSFLNQETGQLFSGDLYVHPQTKLILREESVPQIIASLEHVLTYDFGELFCCHAGYVKDGKLALLNKLDYLQELRGKIHLLKEQGYGEQEIHSLLFKKKYPMSIFSSGEWDSIYIVRSILEE